MDLEISQERLEFILSNPSTMAMTALELLSFVVGLCYWKKFSKTPIVVFILFLGYNFLNEVAAAFVLVANLAERNTAFYNLRYLIYFSALFWIYFKYLNKRSFKNTVVAFYAVWLLTYIYFVATSYFLYQKPLFSAVTGDMLLLMVVLLYLVETINSADLSKIQDHVLIYISIGLVISTVVQLPASVAIYVGWYKITDASDSLNAFYKIIRDASFWAYCISYLIFAYGFYRAKSSNYLMQ